jgi:hypothetical protein
MSLNFNEIAKDCFDALKTKYTTVHDLEQEHTRIAHLCADKVESPAAQAKLAPSILRYGGGQVSTHACYMCNQNAVINEHNAQRQLHKLSYLPAYFVVLCEACAHVLYK